MSKFKIITDSSSDLTKEIREKYDLDYFQMGLYVDEHVTIADLDWGEYSFEVFYKLLEDHHKVKTSLITYETFYKKVEDYFKKGYDVLYLGCSTALTGSINNFNTVKEDILASYPDRRMVAVPTYAASITLGLMVIDAAKQKANGASLDEVVKWVEDNRYHYNQFCTVDTLSYLKDAGRIKAGKAFFGNLMGVKPIFISDIRGDNTVISKSKGTKASLDAIANYIKEAIDLEKDDRVCIVHANCPDRVELLKNKIHEELGTDHIYVFPMGPIIGATCGPNTIAAFCYGKDVSRFEADGQE